MTRLVHLLVCWALLLASCATQKTEEVIAPAQAVSPTDPLATPSSTEPAAESKATPGAIPAQEAQPATDPSNVLALLGALMISAEHSDGYDRDLFKHWIDTDSDGCDTRKEVLLDEAVAAPSQGNRCSLQNGTWISRYDGVTAQGDGGDFDVDHLVPLAEAWESGAYAWTSQRREDFANDLGYADSLIAVSAKSNRSKGARDPASWLPPETEQHCWYAASWVNVKTRWTLAIDQVEANTLHNILNGCTANGFDVGLPAPVIADKAAVSTESPQVEESAATQSVELASGCHAAYSPCLPNLSGDAINCGDLTSGQKPVTVLEVGVDPYQLDRDQDGQGCTG